MLTFPINADVYNSLSQGERFIFDWQYGQFYQGDFWWEFCQCLKTADEHNLHRLSHSFPIEVDAFNRFRGEHGWWQSIEAKFK